MTKFYALLAAFGLLVGLTGCFENIEEEPPLPPYRPLLMSRANLEQAVALVPARDLHDAGKIYLKGRYVYINERYEGIHIIDNQNPAQPRNVGFLRIPGNIDIAMRGNVLYADNAVDLIGLDLSDLGNVRVVSRVRNALPELTPPEPASIEPGYRTENRPADAVVVRWQKIN